VTLYATDESGEPICVDCLHGACITITGWECRAEHCRCGCHTATEATRRAARDLEAERYQDATFSSDEYRQLITERFGRPPRSRA
jgi:hypothetical protein